MLEDLLARLEKIETYQTFQDDTLETLNQTVIQLQTEVLKLKEQLYLLCERMKTTQSSHIIPQSEEIPPPHY